MQSSDAVIIFHISAEGNNAKKKLSNLLSCFFFPSVYPKFRISIGATKHSNIGILRSRFKVEPWIKSEE